jgi:hypothetical protein
MSGKTGWYKITYKNPFTANPTIVATASKDTDNYLGVKESDQYHFVICNYDHNVADDGDFYFIVIGK